MYAAKMPGEVDTIKKFYQALSQRYSPKRNRTPYKIAFERATQQPQETAVEVIDKVSSWRRKGFPDDTQKVFLTEVQARSIEAFKDHQLRDKMLTLINQDPRYESHPWTMYFTTLQIESRPASIDLLLARNITILMR